MLHYAYLTKIKEYNSKVQHEREGGIKFEA